MDRVRGITDPDPAPDLDPAGRNEADPKHWFRRKRHFTCDLYGELPRPHK